MTDCEPLRGKITRKFTYINKGFDYDSVKSAVEFYKKYSSNEELLSKERPDIWKLYPYNDNVPYNAITLKEYNEWLFDYTFKDVI